MLELYPSLRFFALEKVLDPAVRPFEILMTSGTRYPKHFDQRFSSDRFACSARART